MLVLLVAITERNDQTDILCPLCETSEDNAKFQFPAYKHKIVLVSDPEHDRLSCQPCNNNNNNNNNKSGFKEPSSNQTPLKNLYNDGKKKGKEISEKSIFYVKMI